MCTSRGVPTRPPRCATHRRAVLTRVPPRVAASWQRGYLTDSSNSAGLIASKGSPSGRLWARAQDGTTKSGALTALAARAEAAAQEDAAQMRGGSAGATHYMSVEAGALASIAAQAQAQILLSKERSRARDAQRQAAQSAQRPANSADTGVNLEDNSPPASPASWASRESLDETAHEESLVSARRKQQQRQQQLERIARLDDVLTARRRVQRKVPCLSLSIYLSIYINKLTIKDKPSSQKTEKTFLQHTSPTEPVVSPNIFPTSEGNPSQMTRKILLNFAFNQGSLVAYYNFKNSSS